MVDLLRTRARERPEETAYVFLQDGEEESGRLTFAELDRRARALAAWLQGRAGAGERALLLYPPGLDFIAAFFGCLYAGVVAVPSYPPVPASVPARPGRGQPRLRAILEDAAPRFVLTTAGLAARLGALAEEIPGLRAAERLATDARTGEEKDWAEPALTPETIAFLQYTSGSTSDPKGVMVSHGNLLHNEEVIRTACGHDERSTFVSWLPMYHDMGLIGGVLQPLYTGATCVLMAPVAFLQRPVRWLRAVSRWRAHTSGAPDFAYELCVRKIPPEQREGLDLSSWRIAFDGSEPVRARTLEAFTEAFAASGFRPEAFFPCYGLAEATLIVSGRAGQAAPLVRAAPEAGARPVVGCGPAGIGLEIAVIDPESLAECGPGEVGEIWVAGPSVARGYWHRPELTERTFRARLPGRSAPFLRTGDLGFLREGQLFVSGRIKDLIIVRGRNHYPQDLELTVADSHPALRSGAGAAFAVETEGGEGVVVVQELGIRRRADPVDGFEAILAAVRQALSEEHEVPVQAIVLVRPGAVPKTTSGKVQRGLCRQRFLDGELEPLAEWQAGGEAVQDAAGLSEPPEASIAWLRRRVAAKLGLAAAEIDPAAPLTRYGLDSLAAVELAHEIETGLGIELPLVALLDSASLEALAASLPAPRGSGSFRVDVEAESLSPGERALWFLQQLDPASPAYNLAGAARIEGAVDEDRLRRAFQALVDRHPALRSTFHSRDGEPFRRIQDEAVVSFRAEDAMGWSEAAVDSRLEAEVFRPFDLDEGPLLRVLLLRRSPAESVLLLVVHHLVADFWSLGLLVRDLGRSLAGLPPGEPLTTPMETARRGDADDFLDWQSRLAGHPFVLDLPLDHPRPARPRHRAAAVPFVLPAEVGTRLAALGRERDSTLFTLLLAVFQALLHRISGQDRLLVGSPTAGRARAALADRVGYFVNPLVLASEAAGDPSFLELAEAARRTVLAAFAHEVPFPELVERLQPERDPGQTPLFQVMFALQRTARREEEALAAFALDRSGARLRLGGLTLESRALRRLPGPLDLTLMAAEIDGALCGSFLYDTDLFDAATIARLGGHFQSLAVSWAAAPDRRLSAVEPWSEAERWQVTGEWNDTAMPLTGAPVDRRVAARAAEHPAAVAVRWGESETTYAELVHRAEELAGQLRRMGVGPEERVALLAGRRPGTVAALLAVLQAGGAYLPIDPGTPPQRVALMIRDSGARVLLTDREVAGLPLPEEVEVVRIDDEGQIVPDVILRRGTSRRIWAGGPFHPPDPSARSSPQDDLSLAYVIYTSGSTGTPKGVQISRRSLRSLVEGHLATCPLGPGDAVSWIAGQGFDVSVLEIWPTLAAGATLCLPDEEARSAPELLWDWIAAAGLTHAFAPTPFAEGLLALGAPALARAGRLRSLWTVGDRLRARPPAGLPFELRNYYGPTEDTVVATLGIVASAPSALLPTIGRPLPNRRVHVLDARLRPVPVGVAGELFLAGTGVARGYHGRPEQTAERFLPDPSGRPGERMYRTGDKVRLRADGEIEFLGRLDAQVKVRGFRVEPGEIEQTLALHPGVGAAVVLALAEPAVGVRLTAFVRTTDRSAVTAETLRSFLADRLPPPMIPAVFVFLEELPLTVNGKLDRRALAALVSEPSLKQSSDRSSERSREAGSATPRSPLEEALAEIWRAALGTERSIGIHDDFFALGGHSLLATSVAARVRAVFGVELPVRALFEAPTIARLAARIEEARRTAVSAPEPPLPPLVPVPHGGGLPLSFAQQRLWFLHQLDAGPAYHLAGALRLTGQLSAAALERTLGAIARRQEALRTTFPLHGDQPVQVIGAPAALRLPLIDLSGLPAERRGAEAGRLEMEEGRRPFDLGHGPLVRASLLRLGAAEHRLAVALHHIIADGWSLGVLLREIGAFYTALVADQRPHLPNLPVQAADFAVWQRGWLQGEALRSRLAWWERQLDGSEPALHLPFDRPRSVRPERHGRVLRFPVAPALTSALEELARRRGATLFMTLLAGWKALLSVHTGQRDLAVGSPVAGRERIEIEGVIGCFVNTLVLRTRIPAEESFAGLLAAVRETALDAYDHQDLPFEKLVEELRPDGGLGEPGSLQPFFQTFFVLQNAPRPRLALPGIEAVLAAVDLGAPKTDLGLTFERGAGGLVGELEIDTGLFDPATGLRLARHLETLLAGAAADPQRPLDLLPVLSEPESWQIRGEWNDSAAPAPWETGGDLIPRRIAARAAAAPRALAVRGSAGALTYGELERRANALAWRLRALGVGPEVRVAVLAERRPETVAAQLAVWKAGGTYVPLDPASPPARSAWLIADAKARVLLTEESFVRDLPPLTAEIVLLPASGERAEPPESALWPESLAYVIYTSGSTGAPKGVEATHGALANFVDWYLHAFGVTAKDAASHVSGLAFDASVLDIWCCLAAGASLHLPDEETRNLPDRLRDWMLAAEITLAFVPTPLLEALLALEWPRRAALRAVVTGGDRLRLRPAPELPFTLWNGYGPTETTIFATTSRVEPADRARDNLPPIGRPLRNGRVHLLGPFYRFDRTMRPVPLGVPGELYVAGAGLARGYLGRPDQTAERFVPDPFGAAGERLYRTGDLARWRTDGEVEFLSRADDQVKIRGFRIEPGEIERTLALHPGVREAVVIAVDGEGRDLAGKRLVAFITPARPDEAPAAAELRDFLAGRLPPYMVPALMVGLEAFPLSQNGKVDRRALAALAASAAPEEAPEGCMAPRGPLEAALAEQWAAVLGLEKVGIHDHFFALGGHSLLAAQLIARVRSAFGVDLPLRTFFAAPTVAGLAVHLEALLAEREAAEIPFPPPLVPVPRRPGSPGLPLSFAQQRLWFLHQLEPDAATYHIAGALRLAGRLDAAALERTLFAIAERQESLRTVFPVVGEGPVQVVAAAPDLPLPRVDLAGLPREVRRAQADRLAEGWAARPFDLARGPLLRLLLVRLGAEENHLDVCLHHIIGDGWSLGVLLREIGALYPVLVGEDRELVRIHRETVVHDLERAGEDREPARRDWELVPEDRELILHDGDPIPGDGDLILSDGEMVPGDGEPTLGDGDLVLGDGEAALGDGKAALRDGEPVLKDRNLAGAAVSSPLGGGGLEQGGGQEGGATNRHNPSISSAVPKVGAPLLTSPLSQPPPAQGGGKNAAPGKFTHREDGNLVLPGLPVQVADFAVWQRAWLQESVLRPRIAWWERQLAGSEPALNLPVDRPAAGSRASRRGGAVRFRLPAGLASGLDSFAQEHGATLFMILLAGWNALLYRLTGQSDIAVGAPVANRVRVEIEGLIGCFVNTLVMRTRFAAEEGFAALLARVREVTLDAQDHQDVPFEKLVEELRPDRAAARTPLFETLFVLQNNSRPRLELPGLALELAPIELGGQQLDLALAAESPDDGSGQLAVSLEFDTALFDRSTILRMAGHFANLLAGAVADPARRLGLLPLLSAAERAQLLREWSPAPQGPPPGGSLLHERFAAWAARTPDAPAVLFEDEHVTYGELDRRSSRLARHLAARGVRPGDRVGLGLGRSVDIVAAILGILKAGAAWVPLDPAYPPGRLAFMIEDAGVRISLQDLKDLDDLPAAAESPSPALPGSALAYVLYTSGSTGQPKGVACHHAGIVNLLAEVATWPLPAGAVGCQWASLSFDVCIYEIFSPLQNGGRVDIAPDRAHGDGGAYAAWLRERGIESAYVPPGLLADVAGALRQGGLRLRRLLTGVEPIPESLLVEIAESCPGLHVINGYGPTETAVAVTKYPVPRRRGFNNTPIGRPLRATRLYVLSPEGEPVPVGVAGELSAAGAGVAWGYLNRPDLTAERFVPDPFSDGVGGAGGERMYRTGDRVRWLADGNLSFIGRLDQQVKVRGIRIEPGEIEAALRDCPGVRDAAVAVRSTPGGDRRLAAWLVAETEGIDPRGYLRGLLPEAMVPSVFVFLDALPQTANGKTDRAALPDPDWQRPELSGGYTAPRTPVEALLADLWRDLLEVERVGIHDSFFELGGHSLKAGQLAVRVRDLFGIEMPVRTVFEAPTVAGMAVAIGRLLVEQADPETLAEILAEM